MKNSEINIRHFLWFLVIMIALLFSFSQKVNFERVYTIASELHYNTDLFEYTELVQLDSCIENDESEEVSKIKGLLGFAITLIPLFRYYILIEGQLIVQLKISRYFQTMLDLPPPSC